MAEDTSPLPLTKLQGEYTVATLPDAAACKNCIAYCSNGSAGSPCLVFSNGTNWKVVALGATAAAT